MNQENTRMTLTLNPKVDKLMRRQAFNANITLGEMIAKYQSAYLEIQDFIKGKNHCYHCGTKIKSVDEVKAIFCGNCAK